MNVFVLNSGRCGSTTFIAACRHIRNFSAGHESRIHCLGEARLAYPARHIEADNRLSWLLGRLERAYGKDAYYVHLTRAPTAVAESFARRAHFGILKAYHEGILLREGTPDDPLALAQDYLDTVEANIELFLKDKPRVLRVRLENAKEDFCRFWQWIGAEGDLSAALAEWDVRHNASAPDVAK